MSDHACDVLIVGGGGAGLRAGIAAAESRPDLNIGVVSKVYPMRSHTVSAEGGAAAAIKPGDSLDAHAYDTISGADWLCDQDAVEAFVEEAPKEMVQLEHWGFSLYWLHSRWVVKGVCFFRFPECRCLWLWFYLLLFIKNQ